MKTRAKVAENARNAEKILPRGQVMPEALPQEPNAMGQARLVRSEERQTRATAAPEKTAPETSASIVAGEKAPSAESSVQTGADVVRPSRAEKLAAEITESVVAFKRVGANSLDVSLRPDRSTEISLHLSLRNGQVEIVARLERGDVESLQAHWGTLQQSLSQQGVRVSHLIDANPNTQTSFHQSSGQSADHSQGQRQQTPQSLDELPLVGAMTEPLKGRPGKPSTHVRRGWEMWA